MPEPGRTWAVSSNPPPGKVKISHIFPPDSPRYPEDLVGFKPGYVKRADVAWFASHHHNAEGLNIPYGYAYLFAYAFDRPPGATTLTLPDDDRIRILAVSVTREQGAVGPAHPLIDTLER
jgi:alpha-mannosidase